MLPLELGLPPVGVAGSLPYNGQGVAATDLGKHLAPESAHTVTKERPSRLDALLTTPWLLLSAPGFVVSGCSASSTPDPGNIEKTHWPGL